MKNKIVFVIFPVLIIVPGFLTYNLYNKNKSPLINQPISPIINSPVTSSTSVVYKNSDFGFTFSLPDNWIGYTIVNNTWEGNPLAKNKPKEFGTKLIIRNPKWTSTLPYEDIPVLVFTLTQWESYLKEEFSVSAAPILASELDRNNAYVFALPPRWNFDYSEGYVEAENIIKSNPLKGYIIQTKQ